MSTTDRSPQAAETPQDAAQVLHTSSVIAPITQNPITVLPWHREVAKRIVVFFSPSPYGQRLDVNDVAASVAANAAAYDPHAAQHAETVRLLEEALAWLDDYAMRMSGSTKLVNEIRAHLSALQPATAEKKGTQ
jgi:hypothetical protein